MFVYLWIKYMNGCTVGWGGRHCTEWDRMPVDWFDDGGGMFIFAHPHQDPSSAVQLLEAFARDPDESSLEETKAWQSFPQE